MLESKIKNIIFDLGGVLVDLDRNRCIQSFRSLGIHHVEDLIDPFQQSGFFMQYELGAITTEEFRERIKEESGKQLTDTEIDTAWNSFLAGTVPYRLDALLKLKERYNLYLLSNTNELHWQWCLDNVFNYKGYRADDFFTEAFLSYKIHKAKPGMGIFQKVINETDMLPEDTFFIDDSEANCETAGLLGITTYTPIQCEDWRPVFSLQ